MFRGKCSIFMQLSVYILQQQKQKTIKDTWKTFGAPTMLARAEDNVAEKIPAKIRGSNAEAIPIAYK